MKPVRSYLIIGVRNRIIMSIELPDGAFIRVYGTATVNHRRVGVYKKPLNTSHKLYAERNPTDHDKTRARRTR